MPETRLPYDPLWDEDSRYIPWLDGPNNRWHVCDREGPYTMVTDGKSTEPLVFEDKQAAQNWLDKKYREWGRHPRLKKVSTKG